MYMMITKIIITNNRTNTIIPIVFHMPELLTAETGADVPMFSFVAGGLFEGILFTGTTGLTDSFILLRVMFALIPTILFNLTAIS